MGKHQTQITGVNNPAYQVSKDAWNSAHNDRVQSKFIVERVAATGNYLVYQKDGSFKVQYSDFGDAVNDEAMNGLTSGRHNKEEVTLIGQFDLTEKILVPAYTKLNMDQAKLIRNTSYNNTMIDLLTDDARSVEIHGGILDGSDMAYGCIALATTYNNSADAAPNNTAKDINAWIHNIKFQRYDAYALDVFNLNCSFIDHLLMEGYIAGLGINFRSATDIVFGDIICGTVGGNAVINFDSGSGAIYGNRIYIGGGRYGIRFQGCDDVILTNFSVHDCSFDGVVFEDVSTDYCIDILLGDATIYNNGAFANDSYSNILLDGHTTFVTCDNVHCFSKVANKPKYNFNENTSTCNYNAFLNGTSRNAVTSNTPRLQGAQSIQANNRIVA